MTVSQYQRLDDDDEILLPVEPAKDKGGWDVKGFRILIVSALAGAVMISLAFFFTTRDRAGNTSTLVLPHPTTVSTTGDLKLAQKFDEWGGKFTELEERLGQIKSIDHTEAMNSLEKSMAVLTAENSRRAQSLAQLLSAVEDTRRLLEQQPQKTQNSLPVDPAVQLLANLTPTEPPFRLIAVEEWSGEATALLALDGKTRAAAAGDFIANWKITAVDLLARAISVAPKGDAAAVQVLEVGQ